MTTHYHGVPRYLTVMEVAQILEISPRLVQERCLNGTFKSYQNDENGIWYVCSDTFKTNSLTWARFLEKCNEWLAASADEIQTASIRKKKDVS